MYVCEIYLQTVKEFYRKTDRKILPYYGHKCEQARWKMIL